MSTDVRFTAAYANVGRLNQTSFRKYSYFYFGWHVSFLEEQRNLIGRRQSIRLNSEKTQETSGMFLKRIGTEKFTFVRRLNPVRKYGVVPLSLPYETQILPNYLFVVWQYLQHWSMQQWYLISELYIFIHGHAYTHFNRVQRNKKRNDHVRNAY